MPHCHAELDPLAVDGLLSPEERQAREAAARLVDREVLPSIAEHFDRGTFPRELVPSLADLGVFGATLHREGFPGLGHVAYGLILQELERGDSAIRSCASVQSSLVMWPLAEFGSDEQQARWLGPLQRGESLGCFGLTESGSGSDPASMRTRAVKDGDDWILDGGKLWITNGTIADVAIVWARTDEEPGAKGIRGFVVDTKTRGFSAHDIPRKMSLRASVTSELVFDGVRLPASALLPKARGLGAPLACLNQARFGIAWGAVGAATACYAAARDYAKARVQFGKPIGAFQLVQAKLAKMFTDIGLAQLACIQLGRLKETGTLTATQVSLAKRNNVAIALDAARAARDILGANGITLDYPPMRHLMNLETVRTYEGTHDVHTLVLGRHITGLDGFGGA